MFKFIVSDVCHAFDVAGIGSRVIDSEAFFAALHAALPTATWGKEETTLVSLPCLSAVSAGVGKRTANEDHYVLREHRGQVDAYLRRNHAAAVEALNVVVYTCGAYLRDPDVTEEERQRVKEKEPTHVIVAVLASAGPRAPVSPYRFCHNVAGGNLEYSHFDKVKLVELATESLAYHNEWCVVADSPLPPTCPHCGHDDNPCDNHGCEMCGGEL